MKQHLILALLVGIFPVVVFGQDDGLDAIEISVVPDSKPPAVDTVRPLPGLTDAVDEKNEDDSAVTDKPAKPDGTTLSLIHI